MFFFPKGVNPCYWSKNASFFLFLVLVKTRLEIRFNNVLNRKQNFFKYKKQFFQSSKNRIFPKRLTHAIGKKIPIFSSFVFGQNKTRNKVK